MTITLATLKDATQQEVFDQVTTHLLKQNKKSQNTTKKTCMYRGQNGTCCAAGCLISDEEYKQSYESKNWGTLTYRGFVPDTHKDLIEKLQQIHDMYMPEVWGKRTKSSCCIL